jgi:uncharacterized protein (TIGR02145 family)
MEDTMKLQLTLLLLISFLLSQAIAITITGVVVDSTGKGVSGALVRLGDAGLFVQSNSEGKFKLSDVITGTRQQITNPSSNYRCKVTADSRAIILDLPEASVVSITAYHINGSIAAFQKKSIPCGTTILTLPQIASGVHLFSISINNAVVIVKKNINIGASESVFPGYQPQSLSGVVLRKGSASFEDVLVISREGYYLSRLVIKNSDTSGIRIILTSWVTSTVSDVDGNVYKTLVIGNQEWTTENLRATRFNDNTTIPLVSDSSAWRKLVTPGYCFYNNSTDPDSNKKWGALYNWYAVGTKKLAPAGWHVPTNADWNILESFLVNNGYNFDGTASSNQVAKSMAETSDWLPTDTVGNVGNNQNFNNSSGFRALPSGFRDEFAVFFGLHQNELWWTSTELNSNSANLRDLYFNYPTLYKGSYNKKSGFSIRLVKD